MKFLYYSYDFGAYKYLICNCCVPYYSPCFGDIAGTTSAEEAAKILAENRRLAREQKEREELEKLQLAEAEK